METLAGGSMGYADGVGSNAQFNTPLGIVANPTGTLAYVCDGQNGVVRKINVGSATATTLAGNQVNAEHVMVARDPDHRGGGRSQDQVAGADRRGN